MLKPSYAELMEVLNKDTEGNSEITSRYTIVIAASKRARQIIDGDEPMVNDKKGKPLSTAVEEIYESKIKVVPEGQGTILNFQSSLDEEEYFSKNQKDEAENVKKDIEITETDDDEYDDDDEIDNEFAYNDYDESSENLDENDYDNNYDDILHESDNIRNSKKLNDLDGKI